MKALNTIPHHTTTMPMCPWDGCDYESDSDYGAKIHHKKVHGESLRGELFECEWCGEGARRKRYQLEKHDLNFCSKECYAKHKTAERDGRVVECEVCGEEKYKQPSHLSQTSHGVHFCSYECKGEYYSGENAPNYKGGGQSDFTRTPEGRRWRIAVLERDNHICQDCGAEPDTPHAHHIKPKAKYPKLKTDVDNGVTLCEDCHADRHPEREQLIRSTSDTGEAGVSWAEDVVDQLEEDG